MNGYVYARVVAWPAAFWAFDLLCWIALPALVLLALRRHAGWTLADLGLHARFRDERAPEKLAVVALVVSPFAWALYTALFRYLRAVLDDPGIFHYGSMLPAAEGAGRTALALYFALTAGFVEEVYFRGWLFKVCAAFRHPVAAYMALSPLLFALIHWESGAANTVASYVFGIAYALMFLAFRNLWPLVVSHAFADFVAFG